jgi:TRAP-type mannitol/chloroaromatic compound transport system permease small subunit
MGLLLRFAEGTRRALERIALASGWLLVVMAAVITFDVIARKFGLPVPLTKLQELEWHFHAAVFSLWMGYGYTINAHPRVDSYTESLGFRRKAWIELAGCVLFALPYIGVVAWTTLEFVASSFVIGEGSESVVGLGNRWIIKSVYAAGIWLVLLGILSVLARLVAYLFGGASAAQAGLQIGSSQLEA